MPRKRRFYWIPPSGDINTKTLYLNGNYAISGGELLKPIVLYLTTKLQNPIPKMRGGYTKCNSAPFLAPPYTASVSTLDGGTKGLGILKSGGVSRRLTTEWEVGFTSEMRRKFPTQRRK